MPTRRNVLAVAAAVTGTSIAGCTDDSGAEAADESPAEDDEGDGTEDAVGAELGVAAEWNAIRSRVDDALALGIAEEFSAGAAVAGDTLGRFEAASAEWGAHEQLEETDHDVYEEFEEALEELRLEALDEADLERTRTEAEIADEQLRDAQKQRLSHRNVLAFDMGLFAARIGDVATLGAAGKFDAAAEIAHETEERWENAIVHDEVSAADGDLYAAFEGELPGLEGAAEDEDLEALEEGADAAISAAFDAAYVLSEDDEAAHAAALSAMQARAWDAAVLASLEGVDPETAADPARSTLARFESSRAHDAVGAADQDTYEAFEGGLEDYADALAADDGVDEAAAAFADAALRAQFAVAGALGKAPGDGDHDGEHDHGDHEDLEGGPNVVEGVPEDADRVVEMHAASFEPEELTIEAGETVAFEHVEGEPHTVTAYEDGIPADAAYWASGGFEDEDAAREGWENGRGAVVSGQSYVRTFEVAGTHEFCCIPHEAAGQVGRIQVE